MSCQIYSGRHLLDRVRAAGKCVFYDRSDDCRRAHWVKSVGHECPIGTSISYGCIFLQSSRDGSLARTLVVGLNVCNVLPF